jgi:DNA segregation ATPase FtsK/SpoIIIE, S-DNA-T family
MIYQHRHFMESAPISPVELPSRLSAMVEQRATVRRWRDQILKEEESFHRQLSSHDLNCRMGLSFKHPHAARWPEAKRSSLERLETTLQHFENAFKTAVSARQKLDAATAAHQKIIFERAKKRKLALMLLVVMVGFLILKDLADKTALNEASAAQDEAAKQQDASREAYNQAKQAVADAFAEVRKLSAAMIAEAMEADAVQTAASIQTLPPLLRADWSDDAWKQHDFTQSMRLPYWVAGTVTEQPSQSKTPFVVPLLAPLLGGKCATVIKGSAADSLGLMHSLVLQLAALLPYGATFTLLDPSGAGRSFPMQRGLPFVRPIGVDLARDLEAVWDDIGRIIRTHLDAEVHSFDELPEQTQANERYEFIVAANFPDGYDRRTIETLQKIAKNGPVAGKYLFIHHSAEKELPRDLNWDDFGSLVVLDTQNPPTLSLDGCKTTLLRSPRGSVQTTVLQQLNAAKPPEHNVQWSDLTESDPDLWWTQDAATLLESPVGSVSRDNHLNLWFGVNRDGRPCAHGVLGAMPGSGKSNLYHVFICGLCTRYSPEELNLYLIDGKMGVEFQIYRRLPHARVVALNSAPELSRSVLAELVAEMERRNELFGKLKVVDLPGYRKAGSPAGPRPRLVLMIDEYQELFEEDRFNQASAHLLTLAQQGRSVGIHLLLGSQRFGAAGMLNQAAVFGSIHLRLAMRMSQSDIQGLTEFGRNGKRLIEQCDLPGKIVVNSNSGDDNSNEFGKVALLGDAQRASLLKALETKADEEWPAERRFATVVFDGREQPNFAENPQMVDLIRLSTRPAAAEWKRIATAPIHEQGFGVPDWYEGERPMAFWLGQELNVHGQARVILRRRAMENVLLVGENSNAIYGMLAGMLCSSVISEQPDGLRVFLADRAIPGTPWDGLLDKVADQLFDQTQGALNQLSRTRETKVVVQWLDEWNEELQRRAALDESELSSQPTWLLVLAGVDRMNALARAVSSFGSPIDSPEGEKLRALYTSGPTLGLHVVMSFPSAGPLKQCLDRGQLEHFKHRIVTQMAETDSFLLLGNDQGAKLQRGETRPVFALYQDHTGGSTVKFKPYTVDAQMAWADQLHFVSENLMRWKESRYVHG